MNAIDRDNGPSAEWQFINSGFHPGAYNMSLDRFLVDRMLDGEPRSTLRVYGWKPFAVSLGYNQSIDDFDGNKCAEDGVDIVRRPTGGRAILHAEELTYSIVTRANGRSVSDLYCSISKTLVAGLQELGVDAEFAPTQPDFPLLYKNQSSIPCFASSARHEIQHGGRKLVGSAQRRYRTKDGDDIVLQHGSMLLGEAHKNISRYLSVRAAGVQESIHRDLDMKTIELNTILKRDASFDEVANAVKYGFEREWQINFAESTMSMLPITGGVELVDVD